MKEPGRAILVLGPSGTGKSTFALSALEALGGGVTLLAPGFDEISSYRPLWEDNDECQILQVAPEITLEPAKWHFVAVDDNDFVPSLGEWKADGLKQTINFLRYILAETRASVEANDPLPWPVLVTDTVTALLDEFCVNTLLARNKADVPPPAMSPDGAAFYGGLKTLMRQVFRQCRAIRGYGVHWIATGHVQEKTASSTSLPGAATKQTEHMPLVTGAFRESLPAAFDVVAHTGVERGEDGEHYLLLKPDSKRAAKVRGVRIRDAKISNDWSALLQQLQGNTDD